MVGRHGIRLGHAQLAGAGQQANWQQPQRLLPVPSRHADHRHAERPSYHGADCKVKHRARLGLAQFGQHHDLHVRKGGAQAGQQANQPGKGLVLFHRGAQQHDHARKAGQYGADQRGLRLNFLTGLGKHQCAAHQKGSNPNTAHVIKRHGGGQRQVGNGIKPSRQRHHAHHAAPNVRRQNGSLQRRAAPARVAPHQHHANHAAIKHQLSAIEMAGRKLDAHRHTGEHKCRKNHPDGLHGQK